MWRRVVLLWQVFRGDARRLWLALRHPASPGWLKVGTALLLLYLISPIDLVPDALPIAGWIDDAAILTFGIRFLLSRLPAHIRNDVERRVT